MSTVLLSDALKVSLSDLCPIKGVAITLPGELVPYRISERLHNALREMAALKGTSISLLMAQLRDELNGISGPPLLHGQEQNGC